MKTCVLRHIKIMTYYIQIVFLQRKTRVSAHKWVSEQIIRCSRFSGYVYESLTCCLLICPHLFYCTRDVNIST